MKRRYDDDGLPMDHFRYNPEPSRSRPKPPNPPDWAVIAGVLLMILAGAIITLAVLLPL